MKIHWFSITVHKSYKDCRQYWDDLFFHELGQLLETPRGGRGFQNIDVALNEAKLYYNPVPQSEGEIKEYCHFEFPGSACDAVIPVHFRDFVSMLQQDEIQFKITRLDIAWDDMPFTPLEFYNRVHDGEAVTPVKLNKEGSKNENFSFIQSPFELRDNGEVGTSTCYLGSKKSQRFIRVYDRRGGTRLEFVCRDERAHAVALDMFEYIYGDWDIVARENLLDFIRFDAWIVWLKFIAYAKQAAIKVSSARVASLSKMRDWFERQVAVALSVFYDVHGWEEAQNKFDRMLLEARNKDRSRYEPILQLCQ